MPQPGAISHLPGSVRRAAVCSSRCSYPGLPRHGTAQLRMPLPQPGPRRLQSIPSPSTCQSTPAVPFSSVGAGGHADLTPLRVPEPGAVSLRGAALGQPARVSPGVMTAAGQGGPEVKTIRGRVCEERRQGYVSTGMSRSCGWEVNAALSRLILIKRTQYFLLITLDALNIGQAGWASQCKINQSYMKNPRGTFQLTEFSL